MSHITFDISVDDIRSSTFIPSCPLVQAGSLYPRANVEQVKHSTSSTCYGVSSIVASSVRVGRRTCTGPICVGVGVGIGIVSAAITSSATIICIRSSIAIVGRTICIRVASSSSVCIAICVVVRIASVSIAVVRSTVASGVPSIGSTAGIVSSSTRCSTGTCSSALV
jgi:hypothetical protein